MINSYDCEFPVNLPCETGLAHPARLWVLRTGANPEHPDIHLVPVHPFLIPQPFASRINIGWQTSLYGTE